MPKILINIPSEEKAQEFLKHFVPILSFIEEAHILEDKSETQKNEPESQEEEPKAKTQEENEPNPPTTPEENQETSLVQEPLASYYTPKHSYTIEDIQAIAAQFPPDHRWTYEDLQKHFPQNLKINVEILHNQLFIMPSPNERHQFISGELEFAFRSFIKQNKINGKVYDAPFDVKIDENNVFQPDILYVSVSRYEIIHEKGIDGAPDLVVEIWSESNYKKERDTKKELYASCGVLEFWEVYPPKSLIRVEALDDQGTYQLFSEATENGEVHSKILEGFSIRLEDIFQQK